MLLGLNLIEMALLLVAGVLLDRLFGEPRRFHPLVGFGSLAAWIERMGNRAPLSRASCLTGGIAWLLVVFPSTALAAWFTSKELAQPMVWAAHALAGWPSGSRFH